MQAVAMAATDPRPRRRLSLAVARRNRTWLRMHVALAMTARQIAEHVSLPLRTVQHGLQWARLHPAASQDSDDEKLTDSTAKYAEKAYGQSKDPAVLAWLASLRRRN